MAKVLELQLQYQSFQCIFRIDFLYDRLVWSPCSPRDSQELSPTPQLKRINSSVLSFNYNIALTIQTFVGKVISLLFHMLPKFAIAFPPRSKHLLISWLQLLSAVILEPKKNSLVRSFCKSLLCRWEEGPQLQSHTSCLRTCVYKHALCELPLFVWLNTTVLVFWQDHSVPGNKGTEASCLPAESQDS